MFNKREALKYCTCNTEMSTLRHYISLFSGRIWNMCTSFAAGICVCVSERLKNSQPTGSADSDNVTSKISAIYSLCNTFAIISLPVTRTRDFHLYGTSLLHMNGRIMLMLIVPIHYIFCAIINSKFQSTLCILVN